MSNGRKEGEGEMGKIRTDKDVGNSALARLLAEVLLDVAAIIAFVKSVRVYASE